jgi:hypothetical protein
VGLSFTLLIISIVLVAAFSAGATAILQMQAAAVSAAQQMASNAADSMVVQALAQIEVDATYGGHNEIMALSLPSGAAAGLSFQAGAPWFSVNNAQNSASVTIDGQSFAPNRAYLTGLGAYGDYVARSHLVANLANFPYAMSA